MDTIIFTGSSLSANDAKAIYPDADYRVPIACGDLLKALESKPKRIAIIDGFFHYQAAVWHKEILFALEQGVEIYGAASMGALRAAELYQFGMIGVGDIFERYKSGELNDDDEVAIAHGGAKAGYKPLSDAMVNIRFTLHSAADNGFLARELALDIINTAKSLYYPNRVLMNILSLPQYRDIPEAVELKNNLASWYIDQKREDAIKLIKLLATSKEMLFLKPISCNYTSSLRYLIHSI